MPTIKLTNFKRSSTLATSGLGPVLSVTIVTPDLNSSIDAYRNFLHQRVHLEGRITLRQARRLGMSSLAGAKVAWMANELDERWLRLIEIPDAEVVDPFDHRGWMSLSINVQDLDVLRPALESSPFRIIGEPANLEISHEIRGMQLIGPAGEVLYLTEVKSEIPALELPVARCLVDRVFMPVLLADNRERALETYENLPGTEGVKSDARITVINQARQLEPEQKHPISTIRLRENNLIEIDQLDGLKERPVSNAGLPAGIAFISFASESLPENLQIAWSGSLVRGATGEVFQLIKHES